MDFTNWKYDGHNNVTCSCSTCWPVFGRPLKWSFTPIVWVSEAGTESHWRSGSIRQHAAPANRHLHN